MNNVYGVVFQDLHLAAIVGARHRSPLLLQWKFPDQSLLMQIFAALSLEAPDAEDE